MCKNLKKLIPGDDVHSLAKQFLEKHVTEYWGRESQDKGGHKVTPAIQKAALSSHKIPILIKSVAFPKRIYTHRWKVFVL
jgi:hypothetical protein